MQSRIRMSFFGSSILSSYWNGAATYYRGLIRNLADRGYQVTFYEPDAYDRYANRDWQEVPEWVSVRRYAPDVLGMEEALDEARAADVLVKASGVGVLDSELDHSILENARPGQSVFYWDVDAPATLTQMEEDPSHYLRALIPQFDHIFTYGGGRRVVDHYKSFGAKECTPIYNALDPTTHYPVQSDSKFEGTLGFLGNRLPDRERRVDDYFFSVAQSLPDERFLLGGSGWKEKERGSNVTYLGHVSTNDHNAFNSSLRTVLNINRDSMARYGYSPATRVFEAAGAAACIITDAFDGVENFLEPGKEILVAEKPDDVAECLRRTDSRQARKIGESAYARVKAEHTYAHRSALLDSVVRGRL